MRRFSIIFPVALLALAAGCSKDVETENRPLYDPWVYDEALPVPIQFGVSGVGVKVKGGFDNVEDLTGESIGVFALDVDRGWTDEYGVKDEDALCLDNEVVTCAYDESKQRHMLQFSRARYYPYQSDRNFSFFAYFKGRNTSDPVYEDDCVKVPVTGDNWGNQDLIWARSDARTLYVKYLDQINPNTGLVWGYIPAQQSVDATAYYNGFNAAYIRYIAKEKPQSSIDHSYASNIPVLNFDHRTTCIMFRAVLDDTQITAADAVPVVRSVGIRGDEIYTGADFTVVHKNPALEGTVDVSGYEKGTVMLRTEDGSSALDAKPTIDGVELGAGYFFQPISKDSPLTIEVVLDNGVKEETLELQIDSHVEFKAGFYYTYEIRIYKSIGFDIAVASVSPWQNGWEDAGSESDELGGQDSPQTVAE